MEGLFPLRYNRFNVDRARSSVIVLGIYARYVDPDSQCSHVDIRGFGELADTLIIELSVLMPA